MTDPQPSGHNRNVHARFVVIVTLIAAICALAQPAGPGAARAPLPKLSLSDVTFTPRYVVQGQSATKIRFCERTHNRGRGGTRRRTHNEMWVIGEGGSGVQQRVATRDVPKLRGTKGAPRGRHFSHYGCGRGEATPINLPHGSYEVQICTDRKVRPRNCVVGAKSFFVLKRDWTGTASGENALIGSPPMKLTWQAASVPYRFTSATNAAAGQFEYRFNGPFMVNYQVSGGDADCSAAGGATFQSYDGKLNLDYRNEHYSLVGEIAPGQHISVTVTCEDKTATLSLPVVSRFLTNGKEEGFTNPLPFGATVLSGVYQTSSSGATQYQSNWNLR